MHYFIKTSQDRAEFSVKGFAAEISLDKDKTASLYISIDGGLAQMRTWDQGTPRDEVLEQAWAAVDDFLGTCRDASDAIAFLNAHLDALGAV